MTRLSSISVVLILWLSSLVYCVSGSNDQMVFREDFESGYDGWERTDGFVIFPRAQRFIVDEGKFSFRMTAIGSSGYSGRFEHALDIPLVENTTFEFAYFFFAQHVSYVGYQVEFSDKKVGNYFSLFLGSFVNISVAYVVQYQSESSRTWHFHHVDLYEDYKNAFGNVPADLHITSISMMIGDPYFTKKLQTAYFDSIQILQGEETSVVTNVR